MTPSRFCTAARAFVVALAMITCAAGAYAQCPTTTQSAVPKSPVNGATVAAGTKVHYNWSLATASGVTGYEILVRPAGQGAVNRDCLANAQTDSCDGSVLSAGNYEWEVRTFATTCASGVETGLASFTVGAVCNAPPAPALTSPATGSILTTNPPTLKWTAAAGADKYDIHLNNSVFTSTTTSFNPPALPPGNYAWYVDAIASCDNSKRTQSTSVFTFTVPSCPDVTMLLSPADGANVAAGNVTLSWKSVAGATSYSVFAGLDGATPQFIGSTTNTSLVRALDGAHAVEWYVTTSASNCTDRASAHSHFNTVVTCPTARPALVSPANNATVTLPVTFDWEDVAGANGYNLYVVTTTAANQATLVGSSTKSDFTATSLPAGTTAWFVQALFNNCPPTESLRNAITVNSGSNCRTAAATLISPANNAADVASPVTFDWSDVDGATNYRLLVSFNGGNATSIAVVTDSKFTTNVPSGAYEWYVETIYGTACPTIASQHFKFTVPSCSTVSPTLLAPADGATNIASPVTLHWSEVTGATSYRVFAALNAGPTLQIGQPTATNLTTQLPAGTITWFVEAVLPGTCPSTVSRKSTFTVTGGTCQTAGTTLIAPANGATNVTSPVEFQWSKVDGATKYHLFASYNDGAFADFGTTTDTEVERIIPAGSVAWYVVTSFTGCPDVQSSTFRFTVPGTTCPTGSIALTSPAEGSTVNSPVTFTWSAINGAAAYRLWVSTNGEAFALIARVDNATTTVSPLPSGPVEWYIEAVFASPTCASVTSPHGKFNVNKAANCDANKAALAVSPSGSITTDDVTFSWNATPGATAYRVWVAPSGQPFADVGLTKNTSLLRELTPGSYSWYVETFFDACPSLTSNRLNFKIEQTTARCSSDAPSLISPSEGATNVSSPVTLLWSNVPEAESYRIYVSIDGGTPILAGQTGEGVTSLTRALPPGVIRWIVEANFEHCTSTRSKQGTFTIPKAQNCTGEAAQLVAPSNGATLTNPDVDLVWNAVSGAAGYVVFVRHNDGAPTAIDETGDTHASLRAPEGKVEWWVVTFVAGCPPSESTHFTFTFTPPANCDNKKPLLQSPPDDSAVTQPVVFSWTAVPNATTYRVFAATGDDGLSLVDTTTATQSKPVALPAGVIHWIVEASFNTNCPPTRSPIGNFRVITPPPCAVPAKPVLSAAAQVASDSLYAVRWTPVPNADKYELQESTTADFATSSTFIVAGAFRPFTHTAVTTPVQYFYRVRAISNCSDDRGPYSDVLGVFILPPKPVSNQQNISAEAGVGTVVQKLFLPGQGTPITFSAHADKPWITITPPSGTLPPEGITLTITADASILNLGTNTGTISITYGSGAASKGASPLVTAVNLPVSVSLVTPVSPGGKNTPPPDSLIVPAVGHAAGIGGSLFESDVRLANTSAQVMKYLLNFTPAGSDGTQTGSSTNLQVDPGATIALDDILANFFGTVTSGAVGTLEIRPLTSTTATSAFATSGALSQSLTTVVSSRTYNSTTTGTYGQFVPAVPFSQFISKSLDDTQKQILSLQQIAQSSAYRTNVGLVEGSGEPATVLLNVYDAAGNRVGQIPESIPASGFLQFDHVLQDNGITLTDGRIEVEVTSSTGRVTAYASVLDNITSDPLLVSPVLKTSVASNRYVLPGIGDFDIGIAHWKSDVRIFNAGSAKTTATISYYPQGAPLSPQTTTLDVEAGEVKALDNFMTTVFGSTATAGSVVVTTPASSSLIVTGRTYTDLGSGKGTYGQFIPAVTPAESTSLGGRTLQVLQLEASDRFRTNIGLVETSDNPVTVEVAVILPDSRVTPKTTYSLQPNEFRQISLGVDFTLTNVYNVRATVRVTSGTGKVTAYGSVIDSMTQDPTYVPAQ